MRRMDKGSKKKETHKNGSDSGRKQQFAQKCQRKLKMKEANVSYDETGER